MPICIGVAASITAAVSGSARFVICAPNEVIVSDVQSFTNSGLRHRPRNVRNIFLRSVDIFNAQSVTPATPAHLNERRTSIRRKVLLLRVLRDDWFSACCLAEQPARRLPRNAAVDRVREATPHHALYPESNQLIGAHNP